MGYKKGIEDRMGQKRALKNRDELVASSNPIRRKRAKLGLTAGELAKKAGVHTNTILKMEQNALFVNIGTALAVCKALGMTLDEAFGYLDVEIGIDKQSDKSDSSTEF